MMLGARTAAWSGAPLPYLRRVAYLESHGNEWIGTGIYMSKKEKGSISIKYKTNSIDTENDPIGNYSSGERWPHFCFTCDKGHNNLYSRSWGNWYLNRIDLTVVYEWKLDIGYNLTNRITVGGDLVSESSKTKPNTNVTAVRDFVIGNRGDGRYGFTGRIYHVVFNLSKRFSLIPVLDLSGRPAMYDEVSGNLLYNQGTGEFTWGEIEI